MVTSSLPFTTAVVVVAVVVVAVVVTVAVAALIAVVVSVVAVVEVLDGSAFFTSQEVPVDPRGVLLPFKATFSAWA